MVSSVRKNRYHVRELPLINLLLLTVWMSTIFTVLLYSAGWYILVLVQHTWPELNTISRIGIGMAVLCALFIGANIFMMIRELVHRLAVRLGTPNDTGKSQ
jgi:hypothetical protein